MDPIKELTDRGFRKASDFAGPNKSRMTIWCRDGVVLLLQQFRKGGLEHEAGWDIWAPIDRSNNAAATMARVDAVMAANKAPDDSKAHRLAYEEFWRDLVEREDGNIDLDAVQRELHDFGVLMENAAKVYCHVTDGRVSKLNTLPDSVIIMADDIIEERIAEAVAHVEHHPDHRE